MLQYYIVYKPFEVLSQFSFNGDKKVLKDLFKVPADVYPIGRLDYDSEGLLILTNDKLLNHRLLNPSFAHEREYWVQVDGNITQEALFKIEQGVDINIDGSTYRTRSCKTSLFQDIPFVAERSTPIRFRKDIPAPWISMVLTEGKNRQVRKMTAAVGFPTLRLIRYRIEGIELGNMKPGDILKVSKNTLYKKLFNEYSL